MGKRIALAALFACAFGLAATIVHLVMLELDERAKYNAPLPLVIPANDPARK